MKEITGTVSKDWTFEVDEEDVGKKFKMLILDEGENFEGKTQAKEECLKNELIHLNDQKSIIEAKIRHISNELHEKNGN